MGGDFDEILFLNENEGGSDRPYASMRHFGEALEECCLTDLGFLGPPFTWRKNHGGEGNVEEMLDHFLGTDAWRSLFPHYEVNHLDYCSCDH